MKKILLLIGVVTICLICLILIRQNSNFPSDEKTNDLLYDTTYYFGFGSRSVKIYMNGEVYDDLEIESPNHNPNYSYLKTLTKEEINELKVLLKNEVNSKNIEKFVINLVYGVDEFDQFGRY